MAPLVQPHPAKEDDITAVLGRFKAWNTAIDEHQEQDADAFTGLEEISYEEALGDRGTRRMLPREAVAPQGDLSSAMNNAVEAAKDTVVLSAASQFKTAQANVPANTQPRTNGALDPASRAHGETGSSPLATPVNAIPHITASQNGSTHNGALPPHRQAPQRHAESPVSRQALPVVQKKTAVRASSASSKKAVDNAVALSSRSASPRRAPQAKATTVAKSGRNTVNSQLASSSRAQPTFKAVLENKLAADRRPGKTQSSARPSAKASPVVSTRVSMVPWVQSRSVSLKLRISAGEHATIKAGASEAGLPLAAYMRQCTLDVEVLRKLLKQTISDIRAADLGAFEASTGQPLLAAPAHQAVPSKPSRPGLLKRLKNAWLDRGPEAGA